MFETDKANSGSSRERKGAYVIVCGNEKGGSGKTTTAMHVMVALMNSGHKVASIDLDGRQLSLTRYVENRKLWAKRRRLDLFHSDHYSVQAATSDSISARESEETAKFARILQEVERTHDFVLIDTPGHDGYLMRLAHSMADTLITPMNDSYIDFDVLGKVDPLSGEVTDISHYAQMVRDARRHRRSVDNGLLDWVVVRNRLTHITSRNKQAILDSLQDLAMRLGCRLADGISERVIFRELFPIGLTALDELDEETLGTGPTVSHLSARQEVRALIQVLKLPIDEKGKKRAQARKMWLDKNRSSQKKFELLAD